MLTQVLLCTRGPTGEREFWIGASHYKRKTYLNRDGVISQTLIVASLTRGCTAGTETESHTQQSLQKSTPGVRREITGRMDMLMSYRFIGGGYMSYLDPPARLPLTSTRPDLV